MDATDKAKILAYWRKLQAKEDPTPAEAFDLELFAISGLVTYPPEILLDSEEV